MTRARSAMDDAANKKEVSDENWTGLKQVIASELPSWDSGIPGSVQKGVIIIIIILSNRGRVGASSTDRLLLLLKGSRKTSDEAHA